MGPAWLPIAVELAPIGLSLIKSGVALLEAHHGNGGAPPTGQQSDAIITGLEDLLSWLKIGATGPQPAPVNVPPLVPAPPTP